MVHIRFVVHSPEHEIGTAQLIGGRLVGNNESVQKMIDGKVLGLDMSGPQAAEYFASWSNGYVGSSAVADPDEDAGYAALPWRPTTTSGIDLAAEPVGTAIVAIDWARFATARLVCDSADGSADSEAVLAVLAQDDKIGVDCPFGWPEDFVAAVVAHRDRDGWPTEPDVGARRPLRLRATDLHLADAHGLNPLSVSTDRIGSVAMRWASLMSRHEEASGPVSREGGGRLVEVYPALALRTWSLLTLETSEYKKKSEEGVAARGALLRLLGKRAPRLKLDDDLVAATEHRTHGHDVVDALLAALVAAAAATPDCVEERPHWDSDAGRRASTEGWIAVPIASLSSLAPRRGPWHRVPEE